MPGRHASAVHKDVPWSRILAIVVAAVAVLGAGALGVREIIDARADSCDSTPVAVAVDPALAEAVTDLAREYETDARRSPDTCVQLSVSGAAGADVASSLGGAQRPAMWIPDSSTWTLRVDEPDALENLGQVASSPLTVVTARSAAAELGWPDGDFSWQALAANDQVRVSDPATTAEGLTSALAIHAALGELDDVQRVGALSAMSRAVVPTISDAYASLSEGDSGIIVASEQSVIAHNASADGAGVVAIYPVEGTFELDFPALAVTPADAPQRSREIVTGFADFLQSAEAADRLHAAGFRDPTGAAAPGAGITDGTQPAMPELLELPESEAVAQFMQQWAALSQEMRMLTVIDVSGSMNENVPSGGSRIEVTRDAALEAVELLPASSEVGLWVFSILRDPPDRHHLELAPVGPLNEETEGLPHRDELTAALESLPERVVGGTALYDTTLAAFRHMQETYVPGKVNSVVLMTDGRDEDNPASIGLDALIDTLRDEFDPQAPVPVITIGFGPDADMAALHEISDATGTTAYQAEDADDIEEVFLRAMIERQCRPDC
ncbi:VWA domain-containing protein [Phytoactinopolyspora alkaliphila]|uniref:VWA domain-containing protein n=1 Tax=Phytoactinopolyspora alkaliphila TaxID=1783498 RepID=A0A6N9YRQ5_9ACTN|nr:substrate-binding and VWA domain-containing protein [Phytoactinopolyspora alkaliphila]NED97627.1 VWA domain-containing protein [Phytoactinopolyspora alkaliphila]